MKKLIALFLGILLLLSMTGCGLRGGKAFDPRQIDLNSVRKEKSKTVSQVYVLKYDKDCKIDEALGAPTEGYLYLVVYTDDDYDLAVCKTNGRVQRTFNHEKLFQSAKEANWEGKDYDRAVLLEKAREQAGQSTSRAIETNVWYKFTPDEVSDLVAKSK